VIVREVERAFFVNNGMTLTGETNGRPVRCRELPTNPIEHPPVAFSSTVSQERAHLSVKKKAGNMTIRIVNTYSRWDGNGDSGWEKGR